MLARENGTVVKQAQILRETRPISSLDYRGQMYYYNLGNRGRIHEQTSRSRPGHAGPSSSQDCRTGAVARLGDQPALETGFRRHPSGQRWVSLPCTPQARTRRVDQSRMEGYGKWPTCQVLFAHTTGPSGV